MIYEGQHNGFDIYFHGQSETYSATVSNGGSITTDSWEEICERLDDYAIAMTYLL